MTQFLNPRFSIAPMMEWTDRPCRTFLRLLCKNAVLYSEMLHAEAVVRGNGDHLLRFPKLQHPIVLQLGGDRPDRLAQAAQIGEQWGYDEINLNVGCPSPRVQSGNFGAGLMRDPSHVARLVEAMQEAVNIPVTVKCRIGVDDQDAEKDFNQFIDVVADAGCRHFIVHARKAWLKGLSPKDNREVPPLDYQRVYGLKERRSDLLISINGGIGDLTASLLHLQQVDGVMLGRVAYHNPYLLAQVDHKLFGQEDAPLSRRQIVERMVPHIEEELAQGLRLHQITRHMMGLYLGEPGARIWRRELGEKACLEGAGITLVQQVLEQVEDIRERALCKS